LALSVPFRKQMMKAKEQEHQKSNRHTHKKKGMALRAAAESIAPGERQGAEGLAGAANTTTGAALLGGTADSYGGVVGARQEIDSSAERLQVSFTAIPPQALQAICVWVAGGPAISLSHTGTLPVSLGGRVAAGGVTGSVPLKVIDLMENQLGPDATEKLCVALETSLVEEARLRFNGIGRAGADGLASVVTVSPRLRVLDIRGNGLEAGDVRKLLKAISFSTTISTVDLGSNRLGVDGAQMLAAALERNASVTALNLCNNDIGPEGAHKIAALLAQPTCGIRMLDLASNRIGGRGAEAIFEGAKSNTSVLERLSLSSNSVGSSVTAMRALNEMLLAHRALTQLDLRHNGIPGGLIAATLSDGLASCARLAHIGFSGNPIGRDGITPKLCESLSLSETLLSLDLSSCGLESPGCIQIAGVIAQSKTLADLNLANNNIDDGGADSVAKVLPHSSRLTALDLSMNVISVGGASVIMEALQLAPRLTGLSLQGNSIGRIFQMKVDAVLSKRRSDDYVKSSAMALPRRKPASLPLE
jgi:Ran GTPase-activating protein (RanGAP) involved in mRNA processing and transport